MKVSRRSVAYILLTFIVAGFTLHAMGRPWICTCGTVDLWVNSSTSPKTSQMLADWYSPSHFLHGLIFFFLLWLAARRWSIERRFFTALLVETAWEIVENSPMIIDRYREATVAIGYTGDSVINSLSDIAMMALGFAVARRVPVWVSLLLLVVLELIPLFVIRDNLTLNVWMLLAPSDAIRSWQAGG
ncbi:MAG TPA: DUF2585 family protein [Sphingomicrobium sp.]|nr:DUF2585 family protein [Sphingomicrobium sp.]